MGKKNSNTTPKFHILSDVIRHYVDESGIPLKALSASVGKSYKALLRELNEDDDMAKIGVDTMTLILDACQENSDEPPLVLVWLAERYGLRLCPTDCAPDKDTLHGEMLDDYKQVVALHEGMTDWQHPTVVKGLAAAAHAEIDQSFALYKREWAKEGK